MKLALRGGAPVRNRPFTAWPIYDEREARGLQRVLESRNWGGYPCPNDHAREFGQRFAEHHGARWRGLNKEEKGAGSIGHAGSFSFQTSKLMTAGEGGIVTTSDINLADQVIRLANCGRPARRQSTGEPMLGHNYRMTEFQAV